MSEWLLTGSCFTEFHIRGKAYVWPAAGPLQRSPVQLVIRSSGKICAPARQNPFPGWQHPQIYLYYCFWQASPKTPSKIYSNLILGNDKLLMKTFELNKFTHDSSRFRLRYYLCNTARLRGLLAGFISKATGRSICCPEMGPSRSAVPKLNSLHSLKTQMPGPPHPRSTEPESWGEEFLESVLTSIQRWFLSTLEFDPQKSENLISMLTYLCPSYHSSLAVSGRSWCPMLSARFSLGEGVALTPDIHSPSEFPLSTTTTLTWGAIFH